MPQPLLEAGLLKESFFSPFGVNQPSAYINIAMALHRNIIDCGYEQLDHMFLCHYKPISSGFDGLSRSLIRFKNGRPLDLRAWTECTVEYLTPVLPSREVTIIRALGSHELHVSQFLDSDLSAMDYLGIHLAEALECSYRPSLLVKKRTHKPLKSLVLSERQQEVSGVYMFSEPQTPITSLLILDDILTTGSTMRSIVDAVRQTTACPIHLYTLAMSERGVLLSSDATLQTRHYTWQPGLGWGVHESHSAYDGLGKLKDLIRADFYEA